MIRPAPRVYRCQVSVEQKTAHLFIVRSVPYPLHMAQVWARIRGQHGRTWTTWHVRMLSLPDQPVRGPFGFRAALAEAGEWVGLEAGAMMRERFHGIQRTAMGQGRCPYLGKRLCQGPAEPGSVWCVKHPHGKKVIDDA